jgi:hypothetical protein
MRCRNNPTQNIAVNAGGGEDGATICHLPTFTRAGIFKHSMETGNRVGIGLSHRPAGLHRPAELIP